MIISNLNHLEDLSAKINNVKGGYTEAFLSVYGQATGDIAQVETESQVLNLSYSGPYGSGADFSGVAGFAAGISVTLPEFPDLSIY
ncbi:MAG: hypothetical protein F6K40_32540 [Okeania sp. SIO3I5]|uniref:hypothetical protein n=1 Tax=Okeania sp. SIO3I5 TaxID=2607805 RepID=UPI0013B9323E|nr:hypothetical protein [Okeania sp. SIO3I5]NEQ40699.1 hypothetical protein [Okeania sp. SIO3I5]